MNIRRRGHGQVQFESVGTQWCRGGCFDGVVVLVGRHDAVVTGTGGAARLVCRALQPNGRTSGERTVCRRATRGIAANARSTEYRASTTETADCGNSRGGGGVDRERSYCRAVVDRL